MHRSRSLMNLKQIKHSIIKVTPKFALRSYKLWKIAKTQAHRSPALPNELFDDCRVVAHRDRLLELLPKNGKVAEIGVEYGRFSKKIITMNQPREYVGFDIDFSKIDPEIASSPACQVTLRQGESARLLEDYPDGHFDWIYIDGDHSYEGVKADIAVAKRKVRSGGYLVFNDFAHIVWASYSTFGVHRAVTEFLLDEKWPLRYWAYEQNALYDVVAQKP